MAYIYVIENTENDKKYIGKTNFSVEKRFKEHLRDSHKVRCEQRPLYNAMNMHGEDKFSYRILEEVSEAEATEAEIKWIEEFDSHRTGYNATLGGDGKTYLDYDKIVGLALDTRLTRKEVAEQCDCSPDGVSLVLESRKVVMNWKERANRRLSKPIVMVDKDTDEELLTFPSQMEAARYVIKEGYSTASLANASQTSSKISLVARGKRRTAYGFKWKYPED